MDISVPLAILEGVAVTEQDKQFWFQASSMLVKAGRYERLSQSGFEQAIKQVGYRIATLAAESIVNGLELDETVHFKPETDQLDEIMKTIAMSSGVHPRIVEAYVAFWTDKYTNEFADNYIDGLKS